jgi:hypothetical protein
MWGQQKPAGEASMYPKLVQDLSGWRIRSIGCWLVYHVQSDGRAFYNMYKLLKQVIKCLVVEEFIHAWSSGSFIDIEMSSRVSHGHWIYNYLCN